MARPRWTHCLRNSCDDGCPGHTPSQLAQNKPLCFRVWLFSINGSYRAITCAWHCSLLASYCPGGGSESVALLSRHGILGTRPAAPGCLANSPVPSSRFLGVWHPEVSVSRLVYNKEFYCRSKQGKHLSVLFEIQIQIQIQIQYEFDSS